MSKPRWTNAWAVTIGETRRARQGQALLQGGSSDGIFSLGAHYRAERGEGMDQHATVTGPPRGRQRLFHESSRRGVVTLPMGKQTTSLEDLGRRPARSGRPAVRGRPPGVLDLPDSGRESPRRPGGSRRGASRTRRPRARSPSAGRHAGCRGRAPADGARSPDRGGWPLTRNRGNRPRAGAVAFPIRRSPRLLIRVLADRLQHPKANVTVTRVVPSHEVLGDE